MSKEENTFLIDIFELVRGGVSLRLRVEDASAMPSKETEKDVDANNEIN